MRRDQFGCRGSTRTATWAGVSATLAAAVLAAVSFAGPLATANAGDVPAAGGSSPAPITGLTGAGLARFEIGEAIFRARWRPAPDVSEGIDGLGPLYNAESCAACHGGKEKVSVRHVLRLLRDDGSPDPVYGAQIQDRAVPGHVAEARLAIGAHPERLRLGDGREVTLSRLLPSAAGLAYGDLAAGTRLSLRVPPPLDGLGLIAAIDEKDIRAGADPDDRDGDGISGRTGEAADGRSAGAALARFGWKASAATLARQSAEALHLDMGISSPGLKHPSGDCTPAQERCLAAPSGVSIRSGDAEISDDEIGLVVSYLEGLAPPAAPPATTASESGLGIFVRTGCAACHRPSFVVPVGDARPHLAGRPVVLYSDLLLHDMGEGLSDGRLEGIAVGREWRTQPLWGLSRRLAEMAGGERAGLLHDGRARSIEEAVLWHAGEAERARDAFAALAGSERSALLAFLGGL